MGRVILAWSTSSWRTDGVSCSKQVRKASNPVCSVGQLTNIGENGAVVSASATHSKAALLSLIIEVFVLCTCSPEGPSLEYRNGAGEN